jgi:hypothetical protein
MARVESVGGIATLKRGTDAEDDGSLSVSIRLFAKLDSGLMAIDHDAESLSLQMPTRVALDELAGITATALRYGELPPAHRREHWEGLVAELHATSLIHTDAETLMSLPFDFVPDGELREALGGWEG